MKQITFAQAEHQNKKKVTRRERFLAEMNVLVPWQRLLDALSPSYYPDAAGKRGRPPTPLDRMLRIYFLQQWYGLADEALEDAIYDSQAMRDFVGIDLSIESVPDATTLLRFRHLLERHSLTQRIFEEINASDFTVQSKDNTDLLVDGGKRLDVAVQNVSSLFVTVSHRIGVRGRSKVQRHLRDRTPDLGLVCPATAGLSQVGGNRPGFLHPQFGEGDVLGFCEVPPAPVPATALDARDRDRQGAPRRHQDGEIQNPVLFGTDEFLAIQKEYRGITRIFEKDLGHRSLF